MKGNGWMIVFMEEDYLSSKMVIIIKGSGKIVYLMEKEPISIAHRNGNTKASG